MAQPGMVPVWANVLRFIPLLVAVLVVVMIAIYKTEGYRAIILGFSVAFTFVGVLMVLAITKVLKKKQSDR